MSRPLLTWLRRFVGSTRLLHPASLEMAVAPGSHTSLMLTSRWLSLGEVVLGFFVKLPRPPVYPKGYRATIFSNTLRAVGSLGTLRVASPLLTLHSGAICMFESWGVASRVLSQHADPEAFQLALHAFLLHSTEAFARGLEADRSPFLEGLTWDAKIASDADMSREAWQRYHRLLLDGDE